MAVDCYIGIVAVYIVQYLTFYIWQDLAAILLPEVTTYILQGFQDSSDDVRAVAADALLPVVDELAATLPRYVGQPV